MDWETHLSKNVNSSQTYLWIKCNSNQNPSRFFEINKLILRFMWKCKGTNTECTVSKTGHSQCPGYNPKSPDT